MQPKGFLGIDVSKGYADFLLLDQNKQVMEAAFQLQDNAEGRRHLQALLKHWFAQGLHELYCGVESTGGYENNWYRFLKTLGREGNLHTARLNAKAVKAVSDAALKRTITDAVSAENIAVYLLAFPEKVDYATREAAPCRDAFAEARQHTSLIRMEQKQKVQLNNQLEKLLYQYFAEVLVYCRHGVPGWLLRLLVKYPVAAAVVRAGPAKLSAIKGLSVDKAKAVCQKAAPSTQVVSAQLQHVISVTASEILHKEQRVAAEKAYRNKLLADNENVQLLQSIGGVGLDSAVAVVSEVGDIAQFASAKKLAANFGVHPKFKQSGDGTWGNHMSKQGRGELRAVLYMAALAGIRCNPVLKQVYARSRAKGMKHYQAMGVTMHKLLRIIYGVLKSKTKFTAATDEKNQQQAAEKQAQHNDRKKELKKGNEQKKHRYQSLTGTEAPISRKAHQRRKKEQPVA